MPVCVRACMRVRIDVFMRACVHAWLFGCVRVYACVCIDVCMNAYLWAFDDTMHACWHVCMNVCMNAYLCTCDCVFACVYALVYKRALVHWCLRMLHRTTAASLHSLSPLFCFSSVRPSLRSRLLFMPLLSGRSPSLIAAGVRAAPLTVRAGSRRRRPPPIVLVVLPTLPAPSQNPPTQPPTPSPHFPTPAI